MSARRERFRKHVLDVVHEIARANAQHTRQFKPTRERIQIWLCDKLDPRVATSAAVGAALQYLQRTGFVLFETGSGWLPVAPLSAPNGDNQSALRGPE